MFFLAKTHQRRSGEPPYFENRQKWTRDGCEMEGRARWRCDFHGRRTVCGRRRVVTFHERAKWIVFHRNRRIGRVQIQIPN